MQRGIISAIIIGLLYFGTIKPLFGEFEYFHAKRALFAQDLVAAQVHLTKALSYDPRNTLYLQQLGQIYLFGSKDYVRALRLFEDSLVDFNGDTTGWSSHFLAGVCNLQLGRLDEGKENLRETLRLNPNQEKARQILASLEARKK